MKSKKLDINNWSVKSLLIILFFLLISIVVLWKFVLPNHKVEAGWWNDGWNYRKAVSISNTGIAQTNTQIKILNNYDLSALVTAGKIQADLDDLRFTDINGNLLNYWIEDSTNNSVDIWGVVSSLPTSGTTIYMYYGNPSATSVSSTSNITIGGTMTSIGGYRIHTFTSNGTLTNANNINAEVLVVAGGGGGGSSSGVGGGGAGGGGGGGLTYNASYALTQGQVVNVTVGVGGTNGATSANQYGTDGGNSIFDTITTIGGGGGARIAVNGRSGGSGGGGGYNQYITVRYGGSGTIGIGNSGGATTDLASASGAGGGGAGGGGGNNITGHVGGNGGLGINYSITGVGITYASGGRGGGGAAPVNKTANTGNGGDGAYSTSIPTSGASGIVVVRFLSGTASTPSTEEAGGGPIAYWKFDEGTGTTAYDSTSNQKNGTISNALWRTEDQCISSKCLQFDGVDDTVSINNINYPSTWNDPFSISAWIFVPSSATWTNSYYGTIIAKGGYDGSYGLIRHPTNNQVTMWIRGDNGAVSASGLITRDKWYYLTGTWDGTNIKLYINGVLKQESGSERTGIPDSGSLNIGQAGSYSGAGGNWFNGKIDEPKIYSYARTAAQIKLDYNSRGSSSGSSANLGSAASDNNLSEGLVGYWKMDEGVGTTTTDSSGNSNTGTFGTGSSAPAWSSGKFGIGTSYDGTDDYISISQYTYSTNASISVWVKGNYANGNQIIIGSKDSIALGLYNSGSDKALIGSAGISKPIGIDNNFINDSWNHLVVTFDNSGNATYYCNGELLINSTTNNWTWPDSVAYIGKRTSGLNFKGLIDEVRIYNRALSLSEVSQLYEFAPGPVGYWGFDDGSGSTANDKSGNGLNGTIAGNALWKGGGYCKIGGCLNLDHVDDRVTINHSSLLEPSSITVEGWVKLNSTGDRQILFTKWSGYSFEISSAGYPYFRLNGASPYDLYSSKTINWGQWHYIAATLDNNTKQETIYLDGINVGSTLSTGNISYNQGVLAFPYSTATYANGLIDEFKIYNYARTQKQIIEDMNANHPAVSAKSAIAYYKFDEGYGTTTSNWGNGGTALNGTLTGTTIPTWTNDSKSGKAINLNGINSFARTGVIPASDAFSLSVWFKANQVRDQNRIYWGTGTDKAILAFSGTSGYLTWYMSASGGNSGYKTTSKKININGWNNVVLIYNGSIVKCFINGVEDNTTGTLTGTSVASAINLGTNYNNTGNWFDGIIDEVKAYNYALNSEEVKQDYNQGSALQMGQTSQTISGTTTNLEYCIPGDTSYCVAPVGEWKMDEGSGTSTNDTSGNNNIGTLYNSPSWTQGKIGSALNFNGSNNYIGVPYSSNLAPSAITFEAWAYKPSWTDSEASRILSKTESGGYAFIFSNSNIYSYAYRNGAYATPSTSTSGLSPGWHYFTGSYDGRYTKIYIDGILKNTDDAGANYPITYSYNNSLIIGAEAGSGTSPAGTTYFTGKIDHIKIYDYARTPAQIAYDYNKGGPVGWWKLDECQGNIAYDWSGIGNTGTIIIGASGTQNSLGTCAVGTSAAWTSGAIGKINSSLNFDGNDDYIGNLTNVLATNTNSETISAWVKPNNLSGDKYIFIQNGPTLFHISNDKLVGGIYTGTWTSVTSISSLVANVWSHVVMTYDGSNIKLYINGKFDNSVAKTGNLSSLSCVEIGRFNGGNCSTGVSSYFNGQLDDIRLYNYALTSEQIKTLYNGGAVSFN